MTDTQKEPILTVADLSVGDIGKIVEVSLGERGVVKDRLVSLTVEQDLYGYATFVDTNPPHQTNIELVMGENSMTVRSNYPVRIFG